MINLLKIFINIGIFIIIKAQNAKLLINFNFFLYIL